MATCKLSDPAIPASIKQSFHYPIGQRVYKVNAQGKPVKAESGIVIDATRMENGSGSYGERYVVKIDTGEIVDWSVSHITDQTPN